MQCFKDIACHHDFFDCVLYHSISNEPTSLDHSGKVAVHWIDVARKPADHNAFFHFRNESI